ncbi:MAG: DegT/DnrJ/EryC1/StrS family aminotransferase [Spirochaetia bacterium]
MKKLALFGGNPGRSTPFHPWPVFDEREIEAVNRVICTGNWWQYSYGESSGLKETKDGLLSEVGKFQKAFAEKHGCEFGIAAANGTDTLNILMKALGIGPGDEVIVPAYSYIASASCVLEVNAVPVFVDIDPDTYNIDPSRIEAALTERTRAILPVHFAGRIADMEAIGKIADNRGIPVVEDAAQAHGASVAGRMAGSLGIAGSFSFQASKNMTAGEGGVITTNDFELAQKAESLAWSGRAFGKGWYRFYILGWNARMTEFQGAILRVQLERLEEQTRLRQENASYLSSLLQEIPGFHPLPLPEDPASHAYHLYIIRYREEELEGIPRERIIEALEAEGIQVTSGYPIPLYKNPMFLTKSFWGKACPLSCSHYPQEVDFAAYGELCPSAERACSREALWLKQQIFLGSRKDMEDIAEACRKVTENKSRLLDKRGST